MSRHDMPVAPRAPMRQAGGYALVVASILFIAAFVYLAAVFDYPDILDRDASEVLPRLLAIGMPGRAVWAIYSLLPMLLLPAALSAHGAFRPRTPDAARLAVVSALVAAVAMTLGLARWPTVHWRLAEAYAVADDTNRLVLAAVFEGLNAYLGQFVGEFLGELALTTFFAAAAFGCLHHPRLPAWVGRAGLVAATIGGVAMFRNVTSTVALAAEVNNIVLPVWLIVLGVALVRARDEHASAKGVPSRPA